MLLITRRLWLGTEIGERFDDFEHKFSQKSDEIYEMIR